MQITEYRLELEDMPAYQFVNKSPYLDYTDKIKIGYMKKPIYNLSL